MAATGNNGHQPEPAGADERWMGVEDAAGHLALPVRTVYRLAQRGAIPAVKVGRTWRFKRSLLDTHLATGASSAASAASRPVPARPAPPRADHPRAGRRSQSPPLLDTVSALTDLSVDLSGLRDAAEIGTVLAARLAAPFQVELVALLAREGRDLVSVGPTGDVQLPAGWRLDAAADGLAERIATADAPLAIDDVSAAGDHSIANLGLRSVVFVPIQSGGSWGVLALGSVRPRTFDPIEVDRLIAVAGQTGLALTNAALLAETTRWSAQLERRLASQRQLLEITERLLATRARDGVFEAVADTLAEVVPHDTLTIYLVDREAGCLVPVLARDAYAEQVLASRPRIGQGITGNVIERGEAELINDANSDPRVVHVPGTPTDENESMIVAPIRGHDAAVGSLNLYRTDRLFDEDDLELARLFTNHVAIALENAGVHDRLLRAARTDPLTGLPNRRFFGERVEQAIARRARQAGRLAVLFLDLDGFKLVNDGLGHAAGDLVLAGVAERVRACVRTEDTVARLGGDEFGILLEDVTGAEDAVRTATRVVTSLGAPLTVDGRTWVVRASIGIAVADGAE